MGEHGGGVKLRFGSSRCFPEQELFLALSATLRASGIWSQVQEHNTWVPGVLHLTFTASPGFGKGGNTDTRLAA